METRPGFAPRRPAALVFDLDNTLFAYAPAHAAGTAALEAEASARAAVTAERFRAAFAASRLDVKRRLGPVASSHSRLLYAQGALERLGLGRRSELALDLARTYWSAFRGAAALFPGVHELLGALRGAHVPTAVVTDLTTAVQLGKLRDLGLAGAFDALVTSEEAGADKPDGRPFALVLAKLGVAASDAWMVGDDLSRDIHGARAAGMVTAQKLHAGVAAGAGDAAADLGFEAFAELERLLRERGWVG